MSEKVLAYTCSHGDRDFLEKLVPSMRGTAGLWFDWLVCLSDPSPQLMHTARELLNDPDGRGIQALQTWPGQNRGQHHATQEALTMARTKGYTWLLRLDDDIRPKSKRWLKTMLTRLRRLRELAGDDDYRLVAAPRIIGLKNPLVPSGGMDLGQDFPVETMPTLGGACRLHPISLLNEFEPDLYNPVGRGDPEQLMRYLNPGEHADWRDARGFLVRFPDVRIRHPTKSLEAHDTEELATKRTMGHYWPWLGEGV